MGIFDKLKASRIRRKTYEIAKREEYPVIEYTPPQIKLIKDTFAKGTTDSEFELFIYMSKKYGLDILTKEIWCVKFTGQPAQIYAGRDGFLKKAHQKKRNGEYLFNGMETKIFKVNEPFQVAFYNKKIGAWDTFKSDFQYTATCTVFMKDMEHPITVTVWEEEYSTGQALWRTKRRTMTGKCAESQALRKSLDLTGLYTLEEMNLSILQDQGLIQAKEAPKKIIEAEVTEEKESPALKEKPKETKKDKVKEEKGEMPSIEELKERYMKKHPKSVILTKLKKDVLAQFLIGKFKTREI